MSGQANGVTGLSAFLISNPSLDFVASLCEESLTPKISFR